MGATHELQTKKESIYTCIKDSQFNKNTQQWSGKVKPQILFKYILLMEMHSENKQCHTHNMIDV